MSEESKEEKDDSIEKLMQTMREKNKKYLQRYEEVEKDRLEAEKQGSAITNTVHKTNIRRATDVQSQTRYEREWDRGKSAEGDWSHSRRTARRPTGQSFRKREDSDKKYGQPDTNQKFRDERNARGVQESKQYGNPFPKSRGWKKASDSTHVHSQNMHDEQKEDFDTEDRSKLLKEQEDTDQIWRDEDDQDEARTKQRRVVKWLDTLKDYEWDCENPCDVYSDNHKEGDVYSDNHFQDKPHCSWENQSSKEPHFSKTGKYDKSSASGSVDVKKQKLSYKSKPDHGECSTNTKEVEYSHKAKNERNLKVKKNYASMDLSRPEVRQHTYDKNQQKLSGEELPPGHVAHDKDRKVYSDRRDKSDYREKETGQRPDYSRGRGRGHRFLNADKMQKDPGYKQAASRPIIEKKTDYSFSKHQGKFPAHSNNEKKTAYLRSEASLSDQDTDAKLEYQKQYFRNSKCCGDSKVKMKERESEGIWSDLDTEENGFETKNLNKEKHKEQSQACSSKEIKKEGKKYAYDENLSEGELRFYIGKKKSLHEKDPYFEAEYYKNNYKTKLPKKESEGIWSDLDTEDVGFGTKNTTRDKSHERHREQPRERHREQPRERQREQPREWHRNQPRERRREQLRERCREQSRERRREQSRERRREQSREGRREQSRERRREQSRERHREQSHVRRSREIRKRDKIFITDEDLSEGEVKVRCIGKMKSLHKKEYGQDNYKPKLQKKESEGIWSDLDTEDVNFETEKTNTEKTLKGSWECCSEEAMYKKGYDKSSKSPKKKHVVNEDLNKDEAESYKGENKGKLQKKEGEGIWSDLDTEDVNFETEKTNTEKTLKDSWECCSEEIMYKKGYDKSRKSPKKKHIVDKDLSDNEAKNYKGNNKSKMQKKESEGIWSDLDTEDMYFETDNTNTENTLKHSWECSSEEIKYKKGYGESITSMSPKNKDIVDEDLSGNEAEYSKDNSKAKLQKKESEGILSDLDTEDVNFETEKTNTEKTLKHSWECSSEEIKYKKVDKSMTSLSINIVDANLSDDEAEHFNDNSKAKLQKKESEGILSDLDTEDVNFETEESNTEKTLKHSLESGSEEIKYKNDDKSMTTLSLNIVDEDLSVDEGRSTSGCVSNADQEFQNDATDSYALFSVELKKKSYYLINTEKNDLKTFANEETILIEDYGDIELNKDTSNVFKGASITELTSTPTEFTPTASEISLAPSFETALDESNKLQHSASDISSPIAGSTTYIATEPKIVESQPTKSPEISSALNKTYIVEHPKILKNVSTDEKRELLSESKDLPEKLTSALKVSKKDCEKVNLKDK